MRADHYNYWVKILLYYHMMTTIIVNLEKYLVLLIEKFLSLVLCRNAIMLQHLLSRVLSIICQVLTYRR